MPQLPLLYQYGFRVCVQLRRAKTDSLPDLVFDQQTRPVYCFLFLLFLKEIIYVEVSSLRL
jgi:hypothetical protein